ncbi:MAG: hypothetical protein ACTSU7_02500 [Candidatus Heimdallarchaeaceae archaeon]
MTQLREKSKFFMEKFIDNFKKKLTLNTLIVCVISLALFGFVIYFKNILGRRIFNEVGINYSYIYTNPEGISSTWHFETYLDSVYYYELFTLSFIFDGWNPYARSEGLLDNYMYGPVFLYGEVIFYFITRLFLPGSTREIIAHEGVKWNALVFDTLSVVMLYILIINLRSFRERKITKHMIGLFGAIGFAFIPVNLYYVDAYFLNIPQMTFFTLVTLHLFMKEKYVLSSMFLALAWLSKQIPLFLLIPMFFMLSRKKNISFALKKFLIPHIIVSFILSIPWLFITPFLYIGRIIGAGRPLWYISLGEEALVHGTTLAHSFYYLNCTTLANITLYLNIAMIPFLAVFLMGTFISHFKGKELLKNEFDFYIYMNWFILLLHTFLSRGVFKYYDAYLNPFMIIASLLITDKLVTLVKLRTSNTTNQESVKKGNTSTISAKEKNNSNGLLFEIMLVVSFLISIAGLYGINWWLMITIRYMHPVILLGLAILASFTLPLSIYKSLIVRTNYKMFGRDIKEIFVICFKKIKHVLSKSQEEKKEENIVDVKQDSE